MGGERPDLRALAKEVARRYPELGDPREQIAAGRVLVDGFVVRNPSTVVRVNASITLRTEQPLRGETKLTAALGRFAVPTVGRIALDVGAAAGGFTRALLNAGVLRVYAVDAGHGQLRGSLHLDQRVVALERTNLSELEATLIPEPLGIVTLDLSYLAIAEAAPQLESLGFEPEADLIVLVKPMFELGLPRPPTGDVQLHLAVERAARGLEREHWQVVESMRSPLTGARGAIEFFLHARRRG